MWTRRKSWRPLPRLTSVAVLLGARRLKRLCFLAAEAIIVAFRHSVGYPLDLGDTDFRWQWPVLISYAMGYASVEDPSCVPVSLPPNAPENTSDGRTPSAATLR
jgi:hypothetical protein